MPAPAVVLLSGGLDSSTVLAMAKAAGHECHCLSFRYGQRHSAELECAARISDALASTSHTIADIDLRAFGGSALTDDIEVPKSSSVDDLDGGIPVTYVPARNTIFLSFALALAETLGTGDIFIGVNALDYSGYPDCRPEYIDAFAAMANLATKAGVEGTTQVTIHTPLISMSKAEIITAGLELGVPYELTSSCYDPTSDGRPCGSCDSCLLRLRGFEQAGFTDPLPYPSSVS